MQKVIWGMIGCGDVTEKKSGPALYKLADSSLLAVMRRDGDKAKDYATRHNVPEWYNDADKLINHPDINSIYIATPPSSHKAYAIAALKAGKNVYVEKPMSLTSADAAEMVATANAAGKKMTVAHYRRELPMFKKVKEILHSGIIGDVKFAELKMLQSAKDTFIAKSEVNWRIDPVVSGGGLFHDLAPHQLDLILSFFGKPLAANGFSCNQTRRNESDDMVCGQILFEKDIVFSGIWNFNVPLHEETDLCAITGSAGKLSFPVFGTTINIHTENLNDNIRFEMPEHIEQPMIAEVVQYFLGRRDNPCSGESGVEVMDIIDRFTPARPNS